MAGFYWHPEKIGYRHAGLLNVEVFRRLSLKKENVKISFGEGLSPLTKIDFRGFEILMKQDNLLPTGSFKDRGAAMVINFLKMFNVTAITEDSSGNGGAAFAGYSALGGIPCRGPISLRVHRRAR